MAMASSKSINLGRGGTVLRISSARYAPTVTIGGIETGNSSYL